MQKSGIINLQGDNEAKNSLEMGMEEFICKVKCHFLDVAVVVVVVVIFVIVVVVIVVVAAVVVDVIVVVVVFVS